MENPGLQEALVKHGLPHLGVTAINGVFGTSRTLRDFIRSRSGHLYRECQYAQPHSLDDVPTVSEDGDGAQRWYQNGQLHRRGNLPAVIIPCRVKRWYQNGKLHRGHDQPAEIWADNTQVWYEDGLIHRDEGPARIEKDGTQIWYQRGVIHRDEGPAEIHEDGTQIWYQHGKKHRGGDRPAVIWANGTKRWFYHGTEHKEGNPPASRHLYGW